MTERKIKKSTTECFYADGVNNSPATLSQRTITTYNEAGLPIEEVSEVFDEAESNSPARRTFDSKGRLAREEYDGDITEYTYEETPDGGTICRERHHAGTAEEYTDIIETDSAGRETHTECSGIVEDSKYDSKGRLVEVVSRREDGISRQTYAYRSSEGIEVCVMKSLDAEDKELFHSVSRSITKDGVETTKSTTRKPGGEVISRDEDIVSFTTDEAGEDHLLHEEGWIDGQHIYETCYEYAGGDYNNVTIIEKRFDLDCVEKSVTIVEYWD